MSCERVRPELSAFHFGVADAEARRATEAHLLACTACLREYLELKRAIETGEDEPAPSPAVHARLRRAVAEELGVVPRGRAWSWWERPLAVAVAAAAVVVAMGATRVVASAPGAPPHAMTRGELRVR